jgi:hypothetical protein
MSLLSRNRQQILRAVRAPAAWGTLVLVAAPAAQAQQYLFNSRVETTAEWDSNRLLVTNNPPTGEWFQALFGGDLVRNTAQSTFDLRPELIFQDSTLKAVDAFEALVNAKYTYITQKNEFDVIAEFHRQDSYNSEYGQVIFNELNPDGPATEGSGQVVSGIIRDSYQLSPSFTHQFTQRLQGEIDGSFVAVRYATQIPEELVSFNAPNIEANAVWAVSQRSKLAVGPFYSEYDPTDAEAEGTLKSRSYGVNISYRYQTTRTTNSALTLKLGRDEQDQFLGSPTGTNTWGLEWKGTYEWQTSQMQFAVGRFLEPSSVGGEVGLYQIRAQYTRTFSSTLSGDIAARLSREVGIGVEEDAFGDRDRGYGEIGLTKTLSRSFFLTGGYRWLLQRLPTVDAATGNTVRGPTAVNNGVYLTIGWHPIEPR